MSKPDNFTKDRFTWLEQVAGDPYLPAAAISIAIILSSRYLNRRNGAAWPSVETLALDLNITARGVQKASDWLVKRGHLTVQRGGGRNRTNVYRLASKSAGKGEPAFTVSEPQPPNHSSPFPCCPAGQSAESADSHADERVNQRAQKGELARQKRVNHSSPEPIEGNLLREPLDRQRSLRSLAPIQGSEKNPEGFLDRLEESVSLADGLEDRHERMALDIYRLYRFDEEAFFQRLADLDLDCLSYEDEPEKVF